MSLFRHPFVTVLNGPAACRAQITFFVCGCSGRNDGVIVEVDSEGTKAATLFS